MSFAQRGDCGNKLRQEVPRATKVRAITDSGTPNSPAMMMPLSTNRFAPIAIKAAPMTSKKKILSGRIRSGVGLCRCDLSDLSVRCCSLRVLAVHRLIDLNADICDENQQKQHTGYAIEALGNVGGKQVECGGYIKRK